MIIYFPCVIQSERGLTWFALDCDLNATRIADKAPSQGILSHLFFSFFVAAIMKEAVRAFTMDSNATETLEYFQ